MKKTEDESRASSSRASKPGRAQPGPNGRSLRPPRSGISVVDSEDFAGTAASRTGAHQAVQHKIQASAGPDRVALSGAPSTAAAQGTTALCQAVAEHGAQASNSGPLPHLDAIQRSFGRHDVRKIEAHVGGPGRESARAMNARAYATRKHVVFAEAPDLRTAAHEAAHVVQQAGGVRLKSSSVTAGDDLEKHADDVADRVVAGESAEDLLCAPPIASNVPSLQYKLVTVNGRRFETKNLPLSALRELVEDLVSSNDGEAMSALADALASDQMDSQDGDTIPGAQYTVTDLVPMINRLFRQMAVDRDEIKAAIATAKQEFIQRAETDQSIALWETWHQHTDTRFKVCNRAREILEGRGIYMGRRSAWERALQGLCGYDTDNWTDK